MEIQKIDDTTVKLIKTVENVTSVNTTKNQLIAKKANLQVQLDNLQAQMDDIDNQLTYFDDNGNVNLTDTNPIEITPIVKTLN